MSCYMGCSTDSIKTTIYIYIYVNFDALAHANDFLIERREVVFLCCMQDLRLGVPRHKIANTVIEGQTKTWTQHPIPMMSEHSAHLISLPIGFRTWIWILTSESRNHGVVNKHKVHSGSGFLKTIAKPGSDFHQNVGIYQFYQSKFYQIVIFYFL